MSRTTTRNLAAALREKATTGAAVGGWAVSGSGLVAECMAESGIDFLGVDLQHAVEGSTGDVLHHTVLAAEAWGIGTVVRVPWRRPEHAMQVLDAGAAGVIFPMVNTPEEAAEAVSWCRFPPLGVRSWGPVRPSAGDAGYRPDTASADVLCFVMIETVDGLINAREIAEVPGVDGIYVGPTDLTISSLGVLPADDPAGSEALVDKVVQAVRPTGVLLGTPVNTAAEFERRREQGFTLIPIASDMSLITEGLRSEVDAVRTALAVE